MENSDNPIPDLTTRGASTTFSGGNAASGTVSESAFSLRSASTAAGFVPGWYDQDRASGNEGIESDHGDLRGGLESTNSISTALSEFKEEGSALVEKIVKEYDGLKKEDCSTLLDGMIETKGNHARWYQNRCSLLGEGSGATIDQCKRLAVAAINACEQFPQDIVLLEAFHRLQKSRT
jgi:hypothetical protein